MLRKIGILGVCVVFMLFVVPFDYLCNSLASFFALGIGIQPFLLERYSLDCGLRIFCFRRLLWQHPSHGGYYLPQYLTVQSIRLPVGSVCDGIQLHHHRYGICQSHWLLPP